jgi:thioredoxin-dependent peroxiredoxin
MSQKSHSMSGRPRRVTFDRALTAIILVATLAAVPPIVAAGGFGKAPKLGEKAPPFSLLDLDGQRVTLDGELARGPVVLVLLRGWPGYQCPFCTRQFADFLGHASAFEAAGARVVWVYPGPSDSVQQHAREFLASRALPSRFRITTDPDYVFTNAYGLRWDAPQETAYPATFVIDRDATVRFAQISIGHDGRATATDVLKALGELPR